MAASTDICSAANTECVNSLKYIIFQEKNFNLNRESNPGPLAL